MALYLCVDCGGTNTSVVISDASGALVGRAPGGPSNITYLPVETFINTVKAAVEEALSQTTQDGSKPTLPFPQSTSPFVAAWFGISGADSPAAIAKVAEPLSNLLGLPLGPKLVIANDTHLLAAPLRLYPDVKHAVAIIAGTGSIAVSFSNNNGNLEELSRSGGWGWMLGDEGSGFDVGKETLRQLLTETDKATVSGVAPPPSILRDRVLERFGVTEVMELLTGVYLPDPSGDADVKDDTTFSALGRLRREKRISSLPPLVFEAAFEHGDGLALNVLRSCADHLAGSVALLLGGGGDVPAHRLVKAAESIISFGGSLVGIDNYRNLVLEALKKRGHVFKHVVFVQDAAATGASGLAAAFKA